MAFTPLKNHGCFGGFVPPYCLRMGLDSSDRRNPSPQHATQSLKLKTPSAPQHSVGPTDRRANVVRHTGAGHFLRFGRESRSKQTKPFQMFLFAHGFQLTPV